MISNITRYFYTIVYSVDAPINWVQTLSDMSIPAVISPLHDMDTFPDGEKMKPHYHVIFMLERGSQFSSREVINKIGGCNCELIESRNLRFFARYMCHLDSPDNNHYDSNLVRSLSGADYFDMLGISPNKYQVKPLHFYICTLVPNFPCAYVKVIKKDEGYLGKYSIADVLEKWSNDSVYSCKIYGNHYEVVLS